MLARNMATDKNAPMRDQAGDGIGSVSWSRDGLGYSLVGPLAPGVLNPIARRAKLQFESVS
jgi:anti-sigma factor RsiW